MRRAERDGGFEPRLRRSGVAASDTPYLAFTDSDCLPDRRWLERGVAALDKGADVVNGRTVPAREAGPLERTMASGEELLYPTCNVFYRRAAYDAAGGFEVEKVRFQAGGSALISSVTPWTSSSRAMVVGPWWP